MLKQVGRDRQSLLLLLDDMTVPSRDNDYKLHVTSHFTLKEEAESSYKLIENLAKYHKQKLFSGLHDQGYDKTTQEKVIDSVLSLVPFYTCVSESIKGDANKAIPACIIDIAGLIPFAGQGLSTGMRFGTALARSTAMALRYGVRQTTIKTMLQQTGNQLIRYSPFVAKKMTPKIALGLGKDFFRGVDPGFELLASGGAKGLQAMRNVFANIPDKSPTVVRLIDALRKKELDLTVDSNSKYLQIESLNSPAHGSLAGESVKLRHKGQSAQDVRQPGTSSHVKDESVQVPTKDIIKK